MQKLSYKVVWQAVVRIVLTAALVAGAFFELMAITDAVTGTTIMKFSARSIQSLSTAVIGANTPAT